MSRVQLWLIWEKGVWGQGAPQFWANRDTFFGRNLVRAGHVCRATGTLFHGCSSKAPACHFNDKRALNDAADALCWGLHVLGSSSLEGLF